MYFSLSPRPTADCTGRENVSFFGNRAGALRCRRRPTIPARRWRRNGRRRHDTSEQQHWTGSPTGGRGGGGVRLGGWGGVDERCRHLKRKPQRTPPARRSPSRRVLASVVCSSAVVSHTVSYRARFTIVFTTAGNYALPFKINKLVFLRYIIL